MDIWVGFIFFKENAENIYVYISLFLYMDIFICKINFQKLNH